MFDLLKTYVLDHIRPPFWDSHDYSFMWLYTVLALILYFVLGKLSKAVADRQVYNPNRVLKHSERLRKIREKQQEEMLQRLAEVQKAKAEQPEEEKKEEKPEPKIEVKPRRAFFDDSDKKTGGSGYRPNMKERYPKQCGPRGG